jgi:molecular chaperone DnaK (HSP70)
LALPTDQALAMTQGPDVEVHVLEGRSAKKSLGRLILGGITPSDSRIEVTLDIDVKGVGTITACDRATGYRQKGTIKNAAKEKDKNVLGDDLGVKGLGGWFIPLIKKGTNLPVKKDQVFIALKNNSSEQVVSSVKINVLQGEREFAKDNRL